MEGGFNILEILMLDTNGIVIPIITIYILSLSFSSRSTRGFHSNTFIEWKLIN